MLPHSTRPKASDHPFALLRQSRVSHPHGEAPGASRSQGIGEGDEGASLRAVLDEGDLVEVRELEMIDLFQEQLGGGGVRQDEALARLAAGEGLLELR